MNILTTLLADKGSDLIANLTQEGFSLEQAQRFLPEASKALMAVLSRGDEGMDLGATLGKLDIAGLAAQTGIDAGLASNGIRALLPSIADKLGGNDLGGMLGGVSKLFS